MRFCKPAFLWFVFLGFAFGSRGQLVEHQQLKSLRTQSWYRAAYRVSADSVLAWHKKGDVNFDYLQTQAPYWFAPDSIRTFNLANGHYVWVSSKSESLNAYTSNVSQLVPEIIDINNRKLLLLYHADGRLVTNADVTLAGKKARWQSALGGYLLPAKKVNYDDEVDLLLVARTTADTLLMALTLENDNYRNAPKRFADRPLVKQCRMWARKIANLFTHRYNNYGRYKPAARQRYRGFVVFNKPLYKEQDTLKFKAWLTTPKGKPIRKKQTVTISYSKNGSYKKVPLGTLEAQTRGSFARSWPLPDSLPMDTKYTLEMKGPKKLNLFSSSFSTEAYTLPDISAFTINAASNQLLWSDSLALFVQAKDPNGVALTEGKLSIVVLAKQVNQFFPDSVFVADTLWRKELALLPNDTNVVWLPAQYFPKANIDLHIVATLKNAVQEVAEAETNVAYFFKQRRINFTRNGPVLTIQMLEDGKSVPAKANINQFGNWLDTDTLVDLPMQLALHTLATGVDVDVLNGEGKTILNDEYSLSQANTVSLYASSTADSVGFECNNPQQLPVWLTVTEGTKLIWSGKTTEQSLLWRHKAAAKQLFTAKATYFDNDGDEKSTTQSMAIFYSQLKVTAAAAPVVEPGGKDSLKIKVTDYKGRPVPNANLTAVAQNIQLKKSFQYPSLPYYQRFKKQKKSPAPYTSTLEELEVESTVTAEKYMTASRLLGLDSMMYYRWLVSPLPLQVSKFKIGTVFPEVSVYAIEKGRFVPIFITYINQKPVAHAWCNALQDKAYATVPGFAKIGIRTLKAEITVDSIYLQPHFKHNIFINLDSATKNGNISVLARPDTLRQSEKELLARYFVSIEGDGTVGGSSIWSSQIQARIPNGNDTWIAGPFEAGFPINVWKDNTLDFAFPFEPGYRYRLSQKLTRLEKKPFLASVEKLRNYSLQPSFADTTNRELLPPPLRPSVWTARMERLKATPKNWRTQPENCTLNLLLVTDSAISYTVLLPADAAANKPALIFEDKPQMLHDVPPGVYRVLLLDKQNSGWLSEPFNMATNGLNCKRLRPGGFKQNHPAVNALFAAQAERQRLKDEAAAAKAKPVAPILLNPVSISTGAASIVGRITDAVSGDALSGASILFKNSTTGTVSDAQGYYAMPKVAGGRYTMVVSCVGYQVLETIVQVEPLGEVTKNLALKVSNLALNEVVVVGYGTTSKRDITGSVANIAGKSIDQMLQGKVAGVSVTGAAGDANIRIRGMSSLGNDVGPLYVVDGVPMNELPAGLDPNQMEMTVLKGNVATGIYGSRGSNGVILISTGRLAAPALRTQFNDYAYWQPNVFTNRQGEATVPITYPQNLTSWQHMVYAAVRNGKYGSAFAMTRAFRSLQGLLSVPAFVLQGDTIAFVGRAVNYGSEAKPVNTSFKLGTTSKTQSTTLAANGVVVDTLVYAAIAQPDTLRLKYMVTPAKGSADGEERTVPVLATGMQETAGQFFALQADTSFTYLPPQPSLPLKWYAENNLLQVIEKELDALRNYPQACMEQTANKMWGLLMLKQIKKATNQPFNYQPNIRRLQDRLLQYQLANGAWSWWETGNAQVYITTKVLQALRQADSLPEVKKSIRSGYLFLQNQLPNLPLAQKLEALYCLSEGGHVYPYQFALDSIPFDSLSVHLQWQMVRILQNVGLPYQQQLGSLWQRRNETITGELYWGTESWHWYKNTKSTMVLACRVLAADSAKRSHLPELHRYLLRAKTGPYYANTVEQAEVAAVLLQQNPDLLAKANGGASAVTQLFVNGMAVSAFPAAGQTPAGNLVLRKTGPGIVYLGLAQHWWNQQPTRHDSLFAVHTALKPTTQPAIDTALPVIKIGESFNLTVTINAKKQAEFVQITIPIPAGAVYNGKPNSPAQYLQYLKDKVVIYVENLTAGSHEFTIPLRAKLAGSFTINPTRVEMMYFPVFWGNNTLKKVMFIP